VPGGWPSAFTSLHSTSLHPIDTLCRCAAARPCVAARFDMIWYDVMHPGLADERRERRTGPSTECRSSVAPSTQTSCTCCSRTRWWSGDSRSTSWSSSLRSGKFNLVCKLTEENSRLAWRMRLRSPLPLLPSLSLPRRSCYRKINLRSGVICGVCLVLCVWVVFSTSSIMIQDYSAAELSLICSRFHVH